MARCPLILPIVSRFSLHLELRPQVENGALTRRNPHFDGVIGLHQTPCQLRPHHPEPKGTDLRDPASKQDSRGRYDSFPLPRRGLQGIILDDICPAQEVVFASHVALSVVVEMCRYVER